MPLLVTENHLVNIEGIEDYVMPKPEKQINPLKSEITANQEVSTKTKRNDPNMQQIFTYSI